MDLLLQRPAALNSDTQLANERRIKKEWKFIGSQRYRKGMRLYRINSDLEIFEVDIQKQILVDTKGNAVVHRKAYVNTKCLHVWALNEENATRKFANHFSRQIANDNAHR